MTERKPRIRKCKSCGERFQPARSLQCVCSPLCAAKVAQAKREKDERKAVQEARNRLKTRSEHIKEAQAAFNAYIRARDAGKPCICCGNPLGEGAIGGGYDCGHYRSTGSAPHLRFDERNAHAQRKHCNRYQAGRAVDYRIGLIKRIGLEAVEALEADQEPRKWTIPELVEIKRMYVAKRKELERMREEIAA